MHKHIVLAAVVAFGLASPAHADTTAAPAPTSVVEQPWVKAQIVLDATVADVGKGGVRAVATHVSDLEAAMAAVNAPDAASGDASDSGPIYVLADGLEETLFALAAVSAAAKNNPHMSGRKIIAVANPYPGIGLYLGSYYNEIGKPQEALRILDAGLAQFGKSQFSCRQSY